MIQKSDNHVVATHVVGMRRNRKSDRLNYPPLHHFIIHINKSQGSINRYIVMSGPDGMARRNKRPCSTSVTFAVPR